MNERTGTEINTQTLDLSNRAISEELKEQIKNMTTLVCLDLQDTNITDLSFLTSLKNLKELDISGTEITDLSEVNELISLEKLIAHDIPAYDLSPLEELKNLKVLKMERGNVFDVTSLRKITSLEEVDLYSNEALADIKPLAELKNLKTLTIKGTKIDSPYQLECLLKLENLEVLEVNTELQSVADNITQQIMGKQTSSAPIFSQTEKIKKLLSVVPPVEHERLEQVFTHIKELYKNLTPEVYDICAQALTKYVKNPESSPEEFANLNVIKKNK